MSHPSTSHIIHLLLKGLSIGTVSGLTHPITYPISASALLCQANVVRTTDVYKIISYAFAKARNINLFKGGGKATIIKTFMSMASVAVEDIWLALCPFEVSKTSALLVSKIAGFVFSAAINGPLDVIRTRLALEEFGKEPNPLPKTITEEYHRIVREEGAVALYSGWQVVLLQFILDYWFQIWDKRATSKKQQGSVIQLIPMLAKFVTDYVLTVVKIRTNMRNTGIADIFRSLVTPKGLKSFVAGWKIHLLLFPMVMVNMILANVVFLQFKKLLANPQPSRAHRMPPVAPSSSATSAPASTSTSIPPAGSSSSSTTSNSALSSAPVSTSSPVATSTSPSVPRISDPEPTSVPPIDPSIPAEPVLPTLDTPTSTEIATDPTLTTTEAIASDPSSTSTESIARDPASTTSTEGPIITDPEPESVPSAVEPSAPTETTDETAEEKVDEN